MAELHSLEDDDATPIPTNVKSESFYDETIARSAMRDRSTSGASGGGGSSSRQIDPAVEAAGRHADVPDGSVYDTSMIEGTGPSNFWVLILVLIFIALLLGLFIFVAVHFH